MIHSHLKYFGDLIVLAPLLLLLFASIVLSLRTRFIQFRAIPQMISLLTKSLISNETPKYGIPSHQALFTAMSTTIGIGNIAGPLIAIGLGGPGAMIGFFLATIFGSASTFIEVTLSGIYKDTAPKEVRIGGPMFYLNQVFPRYVSVIYAVAGLALLIVWTASQSNALSNILVSYHIPAPATGAVLAFLTIIILFGGIKRVGAISEQMVPFMFLLYVSAISWIILCNVDQVPAAFSLIFESLFNPASVGVGFGTGSITQALRWGLARGFQSNESGLGTSTIPHSLADTTSAYEQGIISVISVFSNGILCLGSGFAVLVTGIYKQFDGDGIAAITQMFDTYFPGYGAFILITCVSLFVFSTILGNCFNGSQFFLYSFGKSGINTYYAICIASIFIGSLFSVEAVFTISDLLLLPVIVPHVLGILLLAFTQPRILKA